METYQHNVGQAFKKLPEIYQVELTNACDLSCPMCLVPDTPIITSTGVKRIEDIMVGDRVLTHVGRYRSVTAVFSRSVRSEELIVANRWKLSSRLSPLMTREHPVFTTSGFVEAEKLADEHVVVPILKTSNTRDYMSLGAYYDFPDTKSQYRKQAGNWCTSGRTTFVRDELRMNFDSGRLVGYYLSEGNAHDEGVQFTFNWKEGKYAQDVDNLLLRCLGVKSEWKRIANTLQTTVWSRFLGVIFSSLFGRTSSEKKMPDWAIQLPDEFLRGVLCGWARGDGFLLNGAMRNPSVGSSSVDLATFMHLLFVRFNLDPTVERRTGTPGFYNLSLAFVEDVKEFYKLIEVKPTCKLSGNKKGCSWVDHSLDYGSGYKAKQSDTMLYTGKVYNIEVAQDNSYTVAFYGAVHNCLRTSHMSRAAKLLDFKLLELMRRRGDFGGSQYVELQMAGEPTLHPELYKIIRFLKDDVGVLVGLSTHGLTLKKKNLANTMLSLDALTISVDSLDPQVYGQMRAPAKVEQLLENLTYMLDTARDAHYAGSQIPFIELQVIKLDYVQGSGNARTVEKWIGDNGYRDVAAVRTIGDCFNEMQGRSAAGSFARSNELCINPWTSVSVNCHGDVVSCCLIFQPDKNQLNWYGNLYENSLYEIWNSDRVKRMQMMHILDAAGLGKLQDQCSKCYSKSTMLIHQQIVARMLQNRR